MEIPDIHVSNITLETFLIENVNLLDIILESLISQYIEKAVTVAFPSGGIPPSGSPGGDLGISYTDETEPVITTVTDSDVEPKIKITSRDDETLLISGSSDAGTDSTVTSVTFSVSQSTTVSEQNEDMVVGAGIFIKKDAPSRVMMHRSVERTVQKVINRMVSRNESIYSAIASVMSTTDYVLKENSRLKKLLEKYNGYFVDLTKDDSSGIGYVWSFVYPTTGSVNYKAIKLEDDIQKLNPSNVKIKLNFDYLAKPNTFVITFTENDTGKSISTTIDLNDGGSHADASAVKFDEPGTAFLVINKEDVAIVSDALRVVDPPDPTPTPSPTVTITEPTPTPTVSPTVTITEPTPTPTISPTITISPPLKDITLLYTLTEDDKWTNVALNTGRMSVSGDRNIAGFTVAFHVPKEVNFNTGDNKVQLTSPFDKFAYRYATTGQDYNILYITGYCTFIGTESVKSDQIPPDGELGIIRIELPTEDIIPVDPSNNKVVGFSNEASVMWEINSSRDSELRSGFYITDMGTDTFVLNVDTNVTGETGLLELEVDGIDISEYDIDKSELGDDWTVSVETDSSTGTEKITIKRTKDSVAKLTTGIVKKIKFKYSKVTGEIKIKKALSDAKEVTAQYLIPEDVFFTYNDETKLGEARIRTKYLKDRNLKAFLVIAKHDMGTVELPAYLEEKGWTIKSNFGRDGYMRVLASCPEPRLFSDDDLLFTYTNTVHAFRLAPQQKNYGFVNAMNQNVVTMASSSGVDVGKGNDTIDDLVRYAFVIEHIHDPTKLPSNEKLGQFYAKSDVTFDGRILINDVVAMVLDLIELDDLYPKIRPLNTFDVQYTIPGSIDNPIGPGTINITGYINKILENAIVIETELSKLIYSSSDKKEYVRILGGETGVGGSSMTIHARVHWEDLTTFSNAITDAGKNMFDDFSVGLNLGIPSVPEVNLTLSPTLNRPKGILALTQKGTSTSTYTVYFDDGTVDEIIYWTNVNSTRIKATTPGSRTTHDFTIPKMLFRAEGADYTMGGGHTVVYAQGYKGGVPVGGEAHHIVVEPTAEDPPVPTWTHTTTFTPTPTTTASTTPTPSPTITDSPEKPLVITDMEKPYGAADKSGMIIPPTNAVTCIFRTITGFPITLDGNQILIIFYSDDLSRVVQYAKSSTNIIFTSIYHRGLTEYNPIFKLFDQGTMKIYDVELYTSVDGTTEDNKFKGFKTDTDQTFTTYMKVNNPINVTLKGPPVPTWTHTTTFTPTPTTTASTTPTPSPTITDSPEKPLVITDMEKPYGAADKSGMIIPPTNAVTCIFRTITGFPITLDGNQILIIFYSDDLSRVVQYAKSSTNIIFTSIYHRGLTEYNPIFKLFDQGTMKIYDVELYTSVDGTTEDNKFKGFKTDTDQTFTTYMKVNNPIGVTLKGQLVMVNNIIQNADNTQYVLDSDDFHWVSFPKIVGTGKLSEQESNMIIPKSDTGNDAQIQILWQDESTDIQGSLRVSGAPGFWTDPDHIISPNKMYLLKCKGLTVKNIGDNTTNYSSNLKTGWNWVGYPLTREYVNDLVMPNSTQILTYNYDKDSVDNMIMLEGTWFVPGNEIWTFKPNYGYYIKVEEDTTITWPSDSATGAASSGQATFEVKHKGEGKFEGTTTDATQFEIEINLETLNPMEFYAGSNLKYDEGGTSKYSVGGTDELASVDRVSDDVDGRLSSESNKTDGHRYRKIRSIEIHVNKHVYLDLSKGDTIMTKDSALADDVVGPPSAGDDDYRKMYTYCARGTDGVDKYTKIMIVNADVDIRTKLALEKYKLKLPENMYVATGDYDSMEIDYSKSYIGTTSVFSRRYDPGSYTHQKYSGDTHGRYDIHNWGFKLNDGVTAVEDGSKGSYLRYSIDDGLKIHKGGVFTTDDSSSRKIYEYIEEGNVEGNVDFFSLT